MKVLIACEESQEVCKAFRRRGHEAYSCDIQEPSGGHPEWHILGDAVTALRGGQIVTMNDKGHYIDAWDVLFIAGYVAGSKEIDELSFRQRVDENYKETYHLHDLLTEYHKKLWWYITQCDYNIYFHNGKVYTKYTDIFTGEQDARGNEM